MISSDHALPIVGQCDLLQLARSTAYYVPKQQSCDGDLALMKRIDAIHLARPFLGSRRIVDALSDEGILVNRKHVQRLMRLMGIMALHPKARTTRPAPGHRVYPYLLRRLTVDRPNQVWCADITYLPMARGFLYLVAIMDWYSRKVLAWRLSNTMDVDFCVDALEEALACYGCPEIFNTDQGSQFTSEAFTGALRRKNVQISMDGRGRWMDNVFIERLWRSVKYEDVYLKAYEDGQQAQQSLAEYFAFYNTTRKHQGLDRQTPDQVYFPQSPLPQAA